MTYKEETYILDSIEQIRRETHENHSMLSDLCSAVNTWLAHHNQENEDDFTRNVIANLVSGVLDGNALMKKQHF